MKNIILKTTAFIMAITFIISAFYLDSESWVPFYICCGSIAWLFTFAYANNFFEGWVKR